MDNPQNFVLLCGHCGNRTVLDIERELERDGESEDLRWMDRWQVLSCRTCQEITVRHVYSDSDMGEESNERVYFPVGFDSSTAGLPKGVADSWSAALAVQRIEPSGFAVLTRRTLEAIAYHEHATGNTLATKLKSLGANNRIPAVLAEMADSIRILGNASAHYDPDLKIEPHETGTIREFTEAILEYLYRAPAKVAAVQERIQAARSQSSDSSPKVAPSD